MEGLDSNWVLTSDVTQAFPKLEPGTYRFRVQSALNNSFTNATEARYSFRIRQAFYKTYWSIGGALLLLIILVLAYIRNREKSIRNLQRLENEKIRFQFDVLRTQVNPHFLFNNFNTLITAIEEDPKMAVEYVEQLSDFFRNIVNYRDKDVITVKEELGLLQTYFFLQQKRYGNNVRLEISLPPGVEQHYFIPPLTLQLLAENAIKHNVVSAANPLQISITAGTGNTLLIANNKLARSSVQPGTGMGLENIISRYKLLTNAEVRIINNADNFIVSLPLIEKSDA
jgi:LytS/YehU family sensor histidine kinase